MPVMPFGIYSPDTSDYEASNSTINNVVPRGDGYGPMQALLAYTSALPSACRGFFYARKNDGSIAVFAGTSTKLFTLDNSTLTWTNASIAGPASLLLANGVSFLKLVDNTSHLNFAALTVGTSYSALSANAQWQFAQFNNYVIAVQANVPPQVYDLTSSTNFAALGGSPPQAAYISIVNRFVVLSGIASPNVYRVQWSGLNATTTWTSGVNQSDFQDFGDGGIVRGVTGGEFGLIFQDAAIRRMTYAPGSPYVFGIDRIATDDGLFAPYSLISAADRVFYCSPQGFKMLAPGGYPTPIGKEKVDRSFFADIDGGNIQLMIGANDPRTTRVYWAYKSINGVTGSFDKILCYDWALDRWTPITASGEYITSLSKPGITLEGIDAAYGSNLDTLTISSFDDISNAAYTTVSAVDASHKLGFFTGETLEATLESGEHGADGRRIFVSGFRPVCDAATVYGSVGYRETISAARSYSAETLVNSIGKCDARVSTRYARAKLRIASGENWTFATGVEPDTRLEGGK